MVNQKKPHSYWNKDRVLKVAKTCKTRVLFIKNHSGAYAFAKKHDLIEVCYKHMERIVKPKGYWTRERVLAVAKYCETRTEFGKKHRSACAIARRDGYYEECCSHMKLQHKPNGYWSNERISKIAKKCKTLEEFRENHKCAYATACANGWREEVCSHLIKKGSKSLRAIYAIEFPGKSVYVGLTYDYKKRYESHINGSSNKNVRERMSNCSYFYWIEFGEWLSPQIAANEEGIIKNSYIKKGFKILNIKPTGGLGGNDRVWTKEKILDFARGCKTRKEFRKYSRPYIVAKKCGYYDECTAHMDTLVRWNKDSVIKIAGKCKTRSEFIKNHSGAYAFAKKHDLIEVCYKHMTSHQKPSGYWTKKRILEYAKKCKTRSEFIGNHGQAYNVAKKDGYIDECYEHMGEKKNCQESKSKPIGYWVKNNVLNVARMCHSRTEFIETYRGAYTAARRDGYYEECVAHMS